MSETKTQLEEIKRSLLAKLAEVARVERELEEEARPPFAFDTGPGFDVGRIP